MTTTKHELSVDLFWDTVPNTFAKSLRIQLTCTCGFSPSFSEGMSVRPIGEAIRAGTDHLAKYEGTIAHHE